jgi:hypothetical protein
LKSCQTSVRDWWKSASQLVGRNSNNPLNCSNVTFASFHLFGKCLVIRLMLKIAHNGLEIIS